MLNIRGLVSDLITEKLRMERQVTVVYRAVVAEIFMDIVKHTPQFSGNLVRNWQIEFKGYPGTYTRLPDHPENVRPFVAYRMMERKNGKPFQKGDDPAVSETIDRELLTLSDLHWNTRVRIVNNTPYADDVEAGMGPDGLQIRPENLHYGKVAMTNYAYAKYSKPNSIIQIIKREGG